MKPIGGFFMKKFLVLLAVIALAATTAMAAADWNFYGSARMTTFYDSTDSDFNKEFKGVDESSTDLTWKLQGNSRVGAKVKNGNLFGRFELGIGHNTVYNRLLYAEYNFDAFKLTVGQAYTPLSDLSTSGQVWGGDVCLGGFGTLWESRQPQLKVSAAGFQFALVTPVKKGGLLAADPLYKEKNILPKIEVSYGQKLDMLYYRIFGGYQTSTLQYKDGDSTDDDTLNAYLVGANAGFSFDNFQLKVAGSWAVNQTNLGQALNGDYSDLPLRLGNAYYDEDGDLKDQTTIMLAAVAKAKFTDMIALEVGIGYRNDKAEDKLDGWDDDTITTMTYYANAPITLAKGVFIVPEVGYIDFGDNLATGEDRGSNLYYGAKWQINF